MKRQKWKEYTRNLFFTLITFTILFGGLEIGLRFFHYRYVPDRNYMGFPWPDTSTMSHSLLEDPVLFWRMKPNSRWRRQDDIPVTLNKNGYRGNVFPEKKTMNEFRIACIGDSCTFGWNANRPYPEILADLLNENEASRIYTALNFGAIGYTSYQGMKMLETEALSYDPDVITIYFGWNDHWFSKFFDDKNQPSRGSITVRFQRFLAKTRFFQGLTEIMETVKKRYVLDKKPIHYRVHAEDYKQNLETMTRLAESRELPILLITAPSDVKDNSFSSMFWKTGAAKDIASVRALHDQYNQIVRDVAQSSPAILVDADYTFKNTTHLHLFNNPIKDPIHPSDKGHQVITQEILRALVKHDLVPKFKLKAIKPINVVQTLRATPNQ